MKISKVRYFSQVWEMDTAGREHILGHNQVILWNDPTYGSNPVRIQNRVLAVPVSDTDPMKIPTANGYVTIPTVAQMQNPAVCALFCDSAENKISSMFGWFFQGLHCTNPWIPSEKMFADKFSGFRKGEQLAIKDVTDAFQDSSISYTRMEDFLPHIMVSPMDPDDAGDTMFDIVTGKDVKVVDTGLLATFRSRNALHDGAGEFATSTLLRHLVAKLWEVTSKRNAPYSVCWKASAHAKYYIGYKFDVRHNVERRPIPAEESRRKLQRRTYLADVSAHTTVLSPLYETQANLIKTTYSDLKLGATGIKTY